MAAWRLQTHLCVHETNRNAQRWNGTQRVLSGHAIGGSIGAAVHGLHHINANGFIARDTGVHHDGRSPRDRHDTMTQLPCREGDPLLCK